MIISSLLVLLLSESSLVAASPQPHTLNEQSSLDLIVEMKILSSNSPKRRILMIPALFGQQIIPFTVLPLAINNYQGNCFGQNASIPILSNEQLQILAAQNPFKDYSQSSEWITALPRGNCPFDQKIFHAQQANFHSAIIFNDGINTGFSGNAPGYGEDIFIRMSSNSLGESITIPSLFAPFSEFKSITDYFNSNETSVIVSLETVKWDFFKHGSLSSVKISAISYVLFYASLLMLIVSITMTLIIACGMIRNLYMFGEITYTGIKKQPKLKTSQLNFPIIEYKLLETTVEVECCAICIDDFCTGSLARELPCGHRFHTTWYFLFFFF